jgi:hypothetical protein
MMFDDFNMDLVPLYAAKPQVKSVSDHNACLHLVETEISKIEMTKKCCRY